MIISVREFMNKVKIIMTKETMSVWIEKFYESTRNNTKDFKEKRKTLRGFDTFPNE